MTDDFYPFLPQSPLPTRVKRCFIAETIIEVRHKSRQSWTVLPGLIYGAIQDRYATQKPLGTSHLPPELLSKDENLRYAPAIQFIGDNGRLVQIGPCMFALSFKGDYPGWTAVREEFEWLLTQLWDKRVVGERERLGVRYIDFFPTDEIKPEWKMSLMFDGKVLTPPEVSIVANLKREHQSAKLQLHFGAIRPSEKGTRIGTALDIDTALTAPNFTLAPDNFGDLDQLHLMQKEMFFGLLSEPFLNELGPEYV